MKPVIRELRPGDRGAIEAMVRATGFFSEEEVVVALELVDVALGNQNQTDYYFAVAELEGRPVGYACHGLRPLTLGTWDLYWIVVDPRVQRSGAGTALLAWSEDDVRRRGARMLVAETSGKPLYEPTRSFYLGRGYTEDARIRDFYKPGDDLVMYIKRFI
ncbi:MAG TPA: GNAT family N-acetyltransferase [Candidatus Ozemobacteraceae bacterium]